MFCEISTTNSGDQATLPTVYPQQRPPRPLEIRQFLPNMVIGEPFCDLIGGQK